MSSSMHAAGLKAFRSLRVELGRLRAQVVAAEVRWRGELSGVDAAYRVSASNLFDYMVARQVDLRPVQLELWKRGLSSLGRIEGHVRDALDQVLARLEEALACAGTQLPEAHAANSRPPTWDEAEQLLHLHTHELFGKKPVDRHVYVMVTAPDAADVDEAWMTRVFDAGMNVLRVNAAHEDERAWRHIVETARHVAAARGDALRVLVDLPGPKLRTVAPHPGPQVLRWKPKRDAFGRVVTPCRVELRPAHETPCEGGEPCLAVPAAIFALLAAGDELAFVDARGRKRSLAITERDAQRATATTDRTAYVVPETRIRVLRAHDELAEFSPHALPERPFRLPLDVGDRFCLEPAPRASDATQGPLPAVGCASFELFASLREGARVLFDDGKLECCVERCGADGAVLRVTHAPAGGLRLRAGKGINLPGTSLQGPTLGADDERALAFAVDAADMVGASFVRDPDDVRNLIERLRELAEGPLGIVLKIETATAFSQLPGILLAAMAHHPVGVMIARGDLAVEVGFERLAEVQEEIMWLCEAAHLPVIWATQVLDELAHTGTATRAEVTDAAMAVRAECVMLNKGPYIADAITTLVSILRRMESHQYKKRSLYRRLSLGVPFPTSEPT